MKQLLAVLIVTGCALGLEAQSVYFSKQYSMFPDLPSVGFKVITMPDGYAFATLEGASNNPKGSVLVITDKQGNFIHTKQFLPKRNAINGLTYHLEDSTFHFWGDYKFSDSPNLYRPYLTKTNWWGDTIWSSQFDYTSYNLCRNAIQLPDGGFMMLTTTSSNLDSNIIGLIRLDSDGNELWHKGYTTVFILHDSYGLYLRTDSTLMVGYKGSYLFYDTLAPPSDGYGILEVDLEGNLKRDTFYLAYSILDSFTGWLSKSGSGDYVFVDRPPFLPGGSRYRLSCVNEDYEMLWRKSPLSNDEAIYAPSFTINDKGNMVSGGISGGFGGLQPYISEVNTEGEILWERIARSPILGQAFHGGASFESIQPTDDGGYIVVGNFQHAPPDYTFQSWLLKLDSLGCFEPGCQTGNYLTVGTDDEPKLESSQPGLVISPNPANESVQISALKGPGRLFITDVQGRPIDTAPINIDGTLTLLTQNWPPGGYLIRYIGEKGKLLGINKLLVVHNK